MGKARKRFEVFQTIHADIETYLDKIVTTPGQWYWRLKSGNSRIIAGGTEGFVSVGNAVKAADRLNDLLAEPLPIEIIR